MGLSKNKILDRSSDVAIPEPFDKLSVSQVQDDDKQSVVAFWVALVWGVHPANVESVVYVSAGQELLFAFFGLIGLILVVDYKRWLKLWGRMYWWVLWLVFLASALAKETGLMVIVLPIDFPPIPQQGGERSKSAGNSGIPRRLCLPETSIPLRAKWTRGH